MRVLFLGLTAFCVASLSASLDDEASTSTGLEPRRTGSCTFDGPCERFPHDGGRRDDNKQGYLLYGAGIGAELCERRARDHHTWCGNHPDAPVHTSFVRETQRDPAFQ